MKLRFKLRFSNAFWVLVNHETLVWYFPDQHILKDLGYRQKNHLNRDSKCHGHTVVQNFAEFAQNLEMFKPRPEYSCIFTIFTCFCTFYVTFQVLFMHFLAQFFLKLSFNRAKKSTFRMYAFKTSVGHDIIGQSSFLPQWRGGQRVGGHSP